jgi:hypothetical protein
MPIHAILITYRDMEGKLSELIRKARDKYKRYFKQLYFDNGLLDFALRNAVDKVPED